VVLRTRDMRDDVVSCSFRRVEFGGQFLQSSNLGVRIVGQCADSMRWISAVVTSINWLRLQRS